MRCRDAGEYPGRGVSAVAFEVELAFEGDRLDDLVQRLKNWLPGPPGSPWRARHSRCSPAGAGAVSKSRAVVVRIADQHLAGQQGGQLRVVEDGQQRLPIISPVAGQREPDGQAVQRPQQVQPQPVEIPGVRGAVPYWAHPAKSLRRAASADRPHSTGVRVHHPYVVGPQAGVAGQCPVQPGHGGSQLA